MPSRVMTSADLEAAGWSDLFENGLAEKGVGFGGRGNQGGFRTIYQRDTFVSARAAAYLKNPDFAANPAGVVVMPTSASNSTAAGTIQGWFGDNWPTSGATFAATWAQLVDISGTRFLEIDEAVADSGGAARLRTTLSNLVPGTPIEVSFLIQGYGFENLNLNTWNMPIKVDFGTTMAPRRLSYIIPGEAITSTSHSLNFARNSTKASGKFTRIGQVSVRPAVAQSEPLDIAIPPVGSNIQLCRIVNGITTPPTDAEFRTYFAFCKRIGAVARVTIGVDSLRFSTFDNNTPPRWTGFDTSGLIYEAWERCLTIADQQGIQLVPDIVISPAGSALDCYKESSTYLDNPAVWASYVSAITAFVTLCQPYAHLIAAYDLNNEGFASYKFGGGLLANPMLAWDQWEQFRRAAYAAVKAVDPDALVMLSNGYTENLQGYESLLFDPANPVADVMGYSMYGGNLSFTATASGSPSQRQVSNTTGKFVSPSILTAGSYTGVGALPENAPVYVAFSDTFFTGGGVNGAFAGNTLYYLKDVNAAAGEFYLSAAPGGARIVPTTLNSGSGTRNIIIEDAGGVFTTARQRTIRNYTMSQRLPMVATEVAGSLEGTLFGSLPYHIPEINAASIRAWSAILFANGFSSLLAWDEYPQFSMLLTDGAINEAGRAIGSAGRVGHGAPPPPPPLAVPVITSNLSAAGLTGSIAAGVTMPAPTAITVPGAKSGGLVCVWLPNEDPTAGITYSGRVLADGAVTPTITNATSGAYVPGNKTIKIRVTNDG